MLSFILRKKNPQNKRVTGFIGYKARTHLAQVDEETAHASIHAIICIAGIWTPHVLHPLRMRKGRKKGSQPGAVWTLYRPTWLTDKCVFLLFGACNCLLLGQNNFTQGSRKFCLSPHPCASSFTSHEAVTIVILIAESLRFELCHI